MSEAIDWSVLHEADELVAEPVVPIERHLKVVDDAFIESIEPPETTTVTAAVPSPERSRQYTDIEMMRILMRGNMAVIDYRQEARAQNNGQPKTTWFNS